jgi:hypothetical protein
MHMLYGVLLMRASLLLRTPFTRALPLHLVPAIAVLCCNTHHSFHDVLLQQFGWKLSLFMAQCTSA